MELLFLEMKGPYPLTEQDIDANVKEKIGNYALGYNYRDTFRIKYIGRSDNDLNQRLKDHIKEGHKLFKFSYAHNATEAYRKECRHYHGSKGTLNKNHPDKPDGLDSLKCPVCGQ
jgi:hypothetical protein